MQASARIASRKALDFMELAEARNNLVKTYSGGMIRRLEIAQAVLHRPRILFLDEPTVGLDPVARQSVWKQVRASCEAWNDGDSYDALYGGGGDDVLARCHNAQREHRCERKPGRAKEICRREEDNA